jgi:hypothetical protein
LQSRAKSSEEGGAIKNGLLHGVVWKTLAQEAMMKSAHSCKERHARCFEEGRRKIAAKAIK